MRSYEVMNVIESVILVFSYTIKVIINILNYILFFIFSFLFYNFMRFVIL